TERGATIGRSSGDTVPLAREEYDSLVKELLTSVRRKEVSSGCHSTNHFYASVSWSCDQATAQDVSFSTSDCGSEGAKLLQRHSKWKDDDEPEPYARALAVFDLTKKILKLREWK